MSTLTLAVESPFSPELAPMPAKTYSRQAPGTLADLSSICSTSLPDLIPLTSKSTASKPGAPKDDSVLSVSWVRPAPSFSSKPASMQFLSHPQALEVSLPDTNTNYPPHADSTSTTHNNHPTLDKDLSPADTMDAFVQITPSSVSPSPVESSSEKPRAVSEGAIRTPLRKLKSSLKIPHLSRVQSASQLSPKSVKFATRLENVKMFDGKDSPLSVSLQNTPLGSPNASFNLSNDYFSIPRSFGDFVTSDSDSDDEGVCEMSYKINNSNFVPPKNIYDKKTSPVYLQKAVLSADKKSLVLIVMCQNLAFEKALSLKMTFNDWKSQLIFNNASYVSSFTTANFDQFRFSVPLAHLPSAITPQFCIKYSVNNETYWDNNNGPNYRFSLSAVTKGKPNDRDKIALKPGSSDSFSYKPPTFSQTATFHLGSNTSSPRPEPAGGLTKNQDADFEELVNKLNSVKNSAAPARPTLSREGSMQPESKPHFVRSNSLQTMRRYSQSYKNKSVEPDSPLQSKGSSVADAGKSASPVKPNTKANNYVSEPAKDLKSTEIASMSYADLLQKYCFNVTQITQSESSPFESMASSRSNSSTAISTEFSGDGLSFQSSSSGFFI